MMKKRLSIWLVLLFYMFLSCREEDVVKEYITKGDSLSINLDGYDTLVLSTQSSLGIRHNTVEDIDTMTLNGKVWLRDTSFHSDLIIRLDRNLLKITHGELIAENRSNHKSVELKSGRLIIYHDDKKIPLRRGQKAIFLDGGVVLY